jgi:antagonist of KipI
MEKIKIIKPGLFTTIQDKGRWGYERFGIPVAGVMDDFAARAANILVGNHQYSEILEITFSGPEIIFYCNEIISITGADMNPKINGESVPMWTSLLIKAGDILSFSGLVSGVRTYIAFSRGIDVPDIMGSKSTFTRGGLGGYKGRKLVSGDEIKLGSRDLHNSGSYLPQKFLPIYKKEETIRVIMGPQDNYFTDDAIETFLNSKYTITSEADRMGYRLDGPKIIHKKDADIISDGIVFGSIQVPGHGSPIIMMADRATTGGYTKIATVITPDLSKLGQMGIGSLIRFKKVSLEEAHQIYKEYENTFNEIKDIIDRNRFEFNKIRKLNLKIDRKSYNVSIREIK